MASDSRRAKRQRAVMATDSDWERIKSRAAACGMETSAYICLRLAAPEPEATTTLAGLARSLDRIEWTTRFIYELERGRVLQSDDESALTSLAQRVAEGIADERRFG